MKANPGIWQPRQGVRPSTESILNASFEKDVWSMQRENCFLPDLRWLWHTLDRYGGLFNHMPKQTDTLIRWLAWTVFTLNAFLQKSCSNHGQTHRGNRQSAAILEKKSAKNHSVCTSGGCQQLTDDPSVMKLNFFFQASPDLSGLSQDSCRELTQLHDAAVSRFFNGMSCTAHQDRQKVRTKKNPKRYKLRVLDARFLTQHRVH